MLARVQRLLAQLELYLLGALFLTMLGVAFYQVIARNVFGGGLLWGDELVRNAVLWVTMLGATSAAGANSHICIDIVARFAGQGARHVIGRFTSFFTSIVCLTLGWYSIGVLYGDYVYQTPGFGPIPAWICELIIPTAAFVMGLRYLMRTLKPEIT
ncbi:uncharacterized protein METZ01_LOCUS26754 [marine metagenome]|uniref:Tripartite ATP-independent periplasmic transporters DctQ component domain-containing protein n=1 Tax=marine metagenome TaxID=408172 RepID=A0A381Q494_9ZZZZ|nr:C4-dicarboxylate ABC transporter permease [Gammaproteobacteria bacterium]